MKVANFSVLVMCTIVLLLSDALQFSVSEAYTLHCPAGFLQREETWLTDKSSLFKSTAYIDFSALAWGCSTPLIP
jgi:hypothetical protein